MKLGTIQWRSKQTKRPVIEQTETDLFSSLSLSSCKCVLWPVEHLGNAQSSQKIANGQNLFGPKGEPFRVGTHVHTHYMNDHAVSRSHASTTS